MESNNKPTLWYFADPMCSWCWGFSPVITEIKVNYANKINIALVMGGLQTEELQTLSDSSREEIFHHWHQVAKMTGQAFLFDGALDKEFVYNTEPACRAVIAAGLIEPTQKFTYFTAIQHAFYAENQDVTQLECLQQLAHDCGIDRDEFKRFLPKKRPSRALKRAFNSPKRPVCRAFPPLF